MRPSWLVFALFVVGCGGEAVIDPPLGTGGASAGTTSSSTSGAVTSTSSGPPGNFSIEVVSALGSANCQPAVPPDPMDMDITLEVDNTMNPQALQVAVDLVTLDGDTATSTFEVDLLQSGLVGPGAVAELDLRKVPGSLTGTPDSGCVWCGQSELQSSRLLLDVVAAGAPFTIEGRADSYSCVF